MSEQFTIKRGDTSPQLIYTLSPSVNLVGASAVFNMSAIGGGAVIDRVAASIEDSAAGVVGFAFTSAQTANAGTFWGEFEITYSDGKIETYPNNGYLSINIKPDLG